VRVSPDTSDKLSQVQFGPLCSPDWKQPELLLIWRQTVAGGCLRDTVTLSN